MPPILLRILLIDHESGLAGLAGEIAGRLPGTRLVGNACRAVDGVREIARLRPDVALVRWSRDFADYLPALRLLRLAGHATRLVALVADGGSRQEATGHAAGVVDAVVAEKGNLAELAPALETLFPDWGMAHRISIMGLAAPGAAPGRRQTPPLPASGPPTPNASADVSIPV